MDMRCAPNFNSLIRCCNRLHGRGRSGLAKPSDGSGCAEHLAIGNFLADLHLNVAGFAKDCFASGLVAAGS